MTVKERVKAVIAEIYETALKSGRDPEEIKLLAATKSVPPERILEAIEAGIRIIGENYVQEAQKKYELIGPRVSWHMIGRLQTNKAKYAVRLFEVIHSLDSLKLAQELQKAAEKQGKKVKVIIQVNISGEIRKGGVSPDNLRELSEKVLEFPNLELIGLMTLPPYSEDPEDSRPFFRKLRELKEKLNEEGFPIKELSMGMSNDFKVAIEEGATILRIGTLLFGPRPK